MGEWRDVAHVSDFTTNEKFIDVNGVAIIIFRLADGFYAIRDRCTHEDFPLSDGDVDDEHIICPLHGAKFCIKTGKVVEAPAFEDVEVYPIQMKDDIIQIKA